MKKIVALLIALLLFSTADALVNDSIVYSKKVVREPLPKFAVSLRFALGAGNDASTSYELSADWYPLQYVGVGLGLEIDDNHGKKSFLSDILSGNDDYDYDPDRVMRFNLLPTLSLRTPIWYISKDKDWGIMLQCKPGLSISIPRNDSKYVDVVVKSNSSIAPKNMPFTYETQHWKNRNGEWLAWRVLAAVSVASSDLAFSAGWTISNYNIMSCRNNMYYKGRRVGGYNNLSYTNTIFLSASFFF